MAIVVDSQTKLTREDCVLLPEDARNQEIRSEPTGEKDAALERRATRFGLAGGRYDRGEQTRDKISFARLPQVRVDLGRVW
jgi:hypothetical protein